MDRRGTLYRLEFRDGKSYIGACIGPAKRRYQRHLRAANQYNSQYPIHQAWRLLGAPILAILQNAVPLTILWAKERLFIQHYNTKIPYGYNAVDGQGVLPGMLNKPGPWLGKNMTETHKQRIRSANTGQRHTKETKLKISRALKGKVFSKEHRQNLRLSHIGKPSGRLGQKCSQETKNKIRQARLGKPLSSEHRHKISFGLQRFYSKK